MAPRGRHRSEGSIAPPSVVSGELGDPGDTDRLEVTFRIEGDEVRLTSGGIELGTWSLADVSMSPIGDGHWHFEAEGDRLVFTPSRPAVLEASALRSEAPASPPRRRHGRRRRATPEPSVASEPARRVAEAPADTSEDPVRRRRIPRFRIVRRRRPPVPDASGTQRESLWLRTVDMARHRGLFGLDRLPVDERNRHGDHEHTWDHRAAGSGLAQHLCTICGAVRR